MDTENELRDLQARINQLAETMQNCQREIYNLHVRLNQLRQTSSPGTTSPVVRKLPESPVESSFENFIGLRFIHLVGIVVLVIGLSIGVKYAIDRELISEVMRIVLAYGACGILFFLSIRLREKYRAFSAILFSGSMASAYFTTYAAYVYYAFLPGWLTFLLMVLFTAFTVYMAIQYDRQEIAVLGMIGAYGIPFLVSANADRVELFFSYILLINLGLLFIAFRKIWRVMQYMALVITWLLFIGWSLVRFSSNDTSMAIMFMAAFFILFNVSALAYHIRNRQPVMPGEIQQLMLNHAALYAAAVCVFVLSTFNGTFAAVTGIITLLYAVITLATVLFLPGEKLLQRLLTGQSLVLLVVFISAQWDGLAVTFLWVGLAVLLFVAGVYAVKAWLRLVAMILMGITLAKLIIVDSSRFSTVQKILSFLVIGVLLLLISFYYQRFNLGNHKNAERND